MIDFAVIGTSNITYEFVSAALNTGRYSLKAVYSRTYEKGSEFAAKFGCKKVFTSLLDLANDKSISTVYVASPNAVHYEQCKLILEHSKNVICEKTITGTPQEFLELKEIADKNGVIIVDAIMSRYSVGREPIKYAIGKIGNIIRARIDFSKISSRYYNFLNGEDVNIFNMKLGGGALMDLGVYCVYAALDLLGIPQSISAKATFLRGGADGEGTAVFRYDGFEAVLTYSKIADSTVASEIIGENGTVKIGQISQFIDASLVTANHTEKLVGMAQKIDVMMGEAVAFANLIEFGAKNAKTYKDISQLTYNVLLFMEEIKLAANIKYH
ncbi:MAG: Gfo/Idh/MocA family oxidoreductase [Ruminococcaceae bacterium]|nr:Gfo/Idh/MocA family oxidoreductase [Oscillospiraceae bacterium]